MFRSFEIPEVYGDGFAPIPSTVCRPSKIHRRPWFKPHTDDIEMVLSVARNLISGCHWCRGRMASDIDGWAVDALDVKAHYYCAVGAIRRANYLVPAPIFFKMWRFSRYHEVLETLVKVIDPSPCISPERIVIGWNDNTIYTDVMAGFNRAIALAHTKEGLNA